MGYSDSDTAITFIVIGSLVTAALVLLLLAYFLRLWIRGPTLGSDNKRKLNGWTVAITGGNSGIGKATAIDLAKRGARVLLLCRSAEKGGKAAADIVKQIEKEAAENEAANDDVIDDSKVVTANPEVVVYRMDLTSLRSVRECAHRILKSEAKLDVLINNAGLKMSPKNVKTEDGFDMQFGVNYLGHFLLTQMLTPLLIKAAQAGGYPRIINVSSRAHHFGVIHWKDVNFYKQSYDGYKAYAQSKLAMVMHAKELATRLQESGVNVFSVNPGETDTNLNRRMSWSRWWSWVYALKLHKLFVKSAHFGAQTTIFCAIDHSLDGAFCSGRYYSNCREARPSGHSTLAKNCKKLWDLSQHYCGLSQRATAAAGTHATSPHRHHHTPTAAAHPHTPTKHPQSPIVSSPQTPNDYEVISNKANTSQSELL